MSLNNNNVEKEKSEMGRLEVEEEEEDRGHWSGKLDFLLSCLGYAVGLGNVWRFPYLCFKYGGGAFLIPYFLMLAIIGIPCFLMELNLGQYSALGPVTVYSNLAPMFKGLGFANFVAQAFVGLYYNMIIAWTIYYLFASFTSHLPWQDCNNDFNDQYCFSFSDYRDCVDNRTVGHENFIAKDLIYINRTCSNDGKLFASILENKAFWYKSMKEKELENGTTIKVDCVYTNATFCNETLEAIDSITAPFDLPVLKRSSSSKQYLEKSVLQESAGIEPENFGTPLWGLALSLLAAWIIIFCCLIKGIKSSGKVVYVTATFPYVVLIILLIRAVTLPGAGDGIYYYLVPRLEKLANIKVWEQAAGQIFFSLSVAGGGLITLSSYNQFHNNILRDTLVVCIGNCMTSFIAGFAIFSVLGFMANEIGLDVEDVVSSGTGLAFITYPDLVTRLPLPTLWAILFFLMLFTLGLDSQFAIVETILTGILDFAPRLRPKKTLTVGIICITGFILGLPLTCPGGGYLLDLLDNYAAVWPYLFIGFSELMIISYVYGYNNYIDDLEEMTNASWLQGKVKKVWSFFYMGLSPLVIFVILCISWNQYKPFTKGDYVYPDWANGIGWLIAMTCILAVPAVMVYMFVKEWYYGPRLNNKEEFLGIWKTLTTPTEKWSHNAKRAAQMDPSASRFEYVQVGDRVLRQRRLLNGMENEGMKRNDLTDI